MSGRRYDTPPKNKASLEQRLRNLIGDDALQLRARRQIGYIAVIAALGTHARDENGEPIFAIKGGVAVELLMGQEARATKDLDAAVRARAEEIESLLRDALARGWDGFSFRLASWEPIHDTAAWRGDIKLQFKGQPFSTVQFEAAPAEGDAGRGTQLVDNTFVDVAALGLSPVGELPLVTLAYMLAQKLHACTDHSVSAVASRPFRQPRTRPPSFCSGPPGSLQERSGVRAPTRHRFKYAPARAQDGPPSPHWSAKGLSPRPSASAWSCRASGGSR